RLSWQEAGCEHVPEDRDAMPVSTVTISPAVSEKEWVSWDVTSLVQAWIDDPSHNFGLLLRETPESRTRSGILQFYSSQANHSSGGYGIGDELASRPLLIVKPVGGWWDHFDHANPELNDEGNWNRPEYYKTVQTRVVHRDGRDELFLLARGSNGIDTWHFNF